MVVNVAVEHNAICDFSADIIMGMLEALRWNSFESWTQREKDGILRACHQRFDEPDSGFEPEDASLPRVMRVSSVPFFWGNIS